MDRQSSGRDPGRRADNAESRHVQDNRVDRDAAESTQGRTTECTHELPKNRPAVTGSGRLESYCNRNEQQRPCVVLFPNGRCIKAVSWTNPVMFSRKMLRRISALQCAFPCAQRDIEVKFLRTYYVGAFGKDLVVSRWQTSSTRVRMWLIKGARLEWLTQPVLYCMSAIWSCLDSACRTCRRKSVRLQVCFEYSTSLW